MAAVLRGLVLVLSVGYVVLYAALVCLRVAYPFELEWLEGACVDHVRTILAGEPLYAKPSLDFIPLTYTPGYFYLAAGLSRIIGAGFLPLRLISIAASIGLLAMLYRLASRETGSAHAGWLAAGCFAAMYGWTDGWLDLARVDSLFLLLVFVAIYLLRWHASSTGAASLAGLLIAAAFLVKQTGLIVGVPLAVYGLWRGWRIFAAYAGTLAIVVLGANALLQRAFDGWYSYYVFGVPAQHPLATEMLWGFWRFDLLRPLPLALVGSAVYVCWRLARSVTRHDDRDAALFYLLAAAGLFGGALASRLHSLSYVNVVLPAYAMLSLLFAIAVHDGAEAAGAARPPAGDSSTTDRAGARVRRWAPSAIYAVALLQLVRLVYAPAALVPTEADVEAGRAFVRALAAMPGDVFVPYHGYLPAMAGKRTHAHAVVIADVIRGGETAVEKGLDESLRDALRTHRFTAVIAFDTPTPVERWLPIGEHYRRAETIVDRRSRFWRPEVTYVRAPE